MHQPVVLSAQQLLMTDSLPRKFADTANSVTAELIVDNVVAKLMFHYLAGDLVAGKIEEPFTARGLCL